MEDPSSKTPPAAVPLPSVPLRLAPIEDIDAATRGLEGLLALVYDQALTGRQRQSLSQRVRSAAPLLVWLTGRSVSLRPEVFPECDGVALERRQRRVDSLRALHRLLSLLGELVRDAYLREQAAAVEEALTVLRSACAEPAELPGPRRRALRAALAWHRRACPYLKLPAPPPLPRTRPTGVVARILSGTTDF